MINLNKYETVILDLGGVIIDISPDLVIKGLYSINRSSKSELEIYEVIKLNQLVEKHEVGHLSDEQFLLQLSAIIENDDLGSIKQIWYSMLGDIPSERIDTINKLKHTHKVLLLSNTNNLHFNKIENYLMTHYNISMGTLFHEVFLSQNIGHRKPNKEIYNHVLQSSRINPSTAIFVDDVLANAKGAEVVGISGYHLDLNQYKLNQIFNYE